MKFLAIVLNEKGNEESRQVATMIGISMAVITLWVVSLVIFGFSLPLYLLTMLTVAALVFVKPSIGLPIMILATMWFQQLFTLEPIILGDQIYKLYPLDVVFIITILSLVFHQAFGKESLKFKLHRLEGVWLLFFGLCGLYLIRGFLDGQADNALVISAFKNYAFYGFLYFLILYSIKDIMDLKFMLKVLLVGGLGLVVFVLIGLFRGQGLWTDFNPLSTPGVRLLSFPHAFYLSFILIITAVLFLYRLRPERSTIVTMWLQLIGVLGSLMRHLWISLFAVTVFMFLVLPKTLKGALLKFFLKNAAVLGLLAALIAFIVIVFPTSSVTFALQDLSAPVAQRAQSLVRSTADSSVRWRLFAWRAARESFIEQPILGIGYGQQLTIDFETYRVVVETRDLHNSLLVLVVQMGILGSLVFLYALFLIVQRLYESHKRRGIYWPYQVAFSLALLLFLSASIWQPYFESNFTGIFFWILMGLLIVSLRLDEEQIKIT